jgi:hypothetical protein
LELKRDRRAASHAKFRSDLALPQAFVGLPAWAKTLSVAGLEGASGFVGGFLVDEWAWGTESGKRVG